MIERLLKNMFFSLGGLYKNAKRHFMGETDSNSNTFKGIFKEVNLDTLEAVLARHPFGHRYGLT